MGNGEFATADGDDFTGFAEDGDASVRDHSDLVVWQIAMDLAVRIYEATAGFPREEMYGLTSQLRRASVSISANIAEGYGRETTGAYVQFLRIAQGSVREVRSLIELSARLNFLSRQACQPLESDAVRISKMLRSLIRALEGSARRA